MKKSNFLAIMDYLIFLIILFILKLNLRFTKEFDCTEYDYLNGVSTTVGDLLFYKHNIFTYKGSCFKKIVAIII